MKTIIYDQPERVGRWVCSKTGGTYTKDDSTAIGLEDDGELIWGAYYNMFNTQSVAIHFSSEQGRRLNYAFIKAAFMYPFLQLGVKKLIGLVDERNVKSARFVANLGAVLEARIKDASPGGDLLIFTMTPDQCKYIKEDHGKKL